MRLARPLLALALALGAPALVGCQSMYYEAMEVFGSEKRDLLKSELRGMVDDQGEAEETFTSALDQVKALTNFDGGDLEVIYDRLKGSYDDAESSSDDIDARMQEIQRVAGDLFAEWESEIDEIGTAKLRESSRRKLRDTRSRFETMERKLTGSRDQMHDVLAVLNDHVLYLKHNLNAAAVGELGREMDDIEDSIEELKKTIGDSIREAQGFLADFE